MSRSVRHRPSTPCRGLRALLAVAVLAVAAPSRAQTPSFPPITVGAGLRTSFVHTERDATLPLGDIPNQFLLDSIRLYVSGPVTGDFKFTFNTDYNGFNNSVGVMDAVGRYEPSPSFNIWVGRFLPPSDRANLHGPYYAHHWFSFTDGVQDGYPGIFQGRAQGAAYWGQFKKVKVQAGVFNGFAPPVGLSTSNNLVEAGRVLVDLWDPEPGYYENGTYYGTKNILAFGVAGQTQTSDRGAVSVDALFERKLPNMGSVTVEAEFAHYKRFGGYDSQYFTSNGGFVLAGYLFPRMMGLSGRFEALGRFAQAEFRDGQPLIPLSPVPKDYNQKTTEVNVSYIIKDFNARITAFFKDTHFTGPAAGGSAQINNQQVGIGLQLQMP